MKRIFIILASLIAAAVLCSCIPVERYYVEDQGGTATPGPENTGSPAPTPHMSDDVWTQSPSDSPSASPSDSASPSPTDGDDESETPSSSSAESDDLEG